MKLPVLPGAHPGFPREGHQPKRGGGGRQPIFWPKVAKKLQENEENWTEGVHPKFYYVDSP